MYDVLEQRNSLVTCEPEPSWEPNGPNRHIYLIVFFFPGKTFILWPIFESIFTFFCTFSLLGTFPLDIQGCLILFWGFSWVMTT